MKHLLFHLAGVLGPSPRFSEAPTASLVSHHNSALGSNVSNL